MSMLTFYINRAGKNLSASRKRKLDDAKDELREHSSTASPASAMIDLEDARERMVQRQVARRGVRDERTLGGLCDRRLANSSCPKACSSSPMTTRRCRSRRAKRSRSPTLSA
jgi:hypothetical protein